MKKITRILAVLAAVTTLTVSAVPAYAEEAEKTTRVITSTKNPEGFECPEKQEYKYVYKIYQQLNGIISDNDLYPDAVSGIVGEDVVIKGIEGRIWHNYVKYLDDKTRNIIEKCIKEQGIDDEHLVFEEMEQNDKIHNICWSKIASFIGNNKLSADITEEISKEDEHLYIAVTFYSDYEEDMNKIKEYITSHDYDSIVPIEYETVDIHDLFEIQDKLDKFLKESPISAFTTMDKENRWVCVCLGEYDENTERDTKLIEDFMKENGIDDSRVAIEVLENPYPVPEALSCDTNGDGKTNIRDCAVIARKIAAGKGNELPEEADYNKDGKKNVRDAAALAKDLANAYNYGIIEE